MATLSEALTAYRICAQAEGKSPKTIRWITTSVSYFSDFLGPDRQDIDELTGNDLRYFIIDLQQKPKFLNHPYNNPQQENISAQSIETYARGIRAFFSYLYREELIKNNPMQKVKMPKVPKITVPTFSQKEIETLISQPDKKTDTGFRDYALLLAFIDSDSRLSEMAFLEEDDVDLENGYLKVMGKGGKERYLPIGYKVARALLKYKMKHRPVPVGTHRFWLTFDGRPLEPGKIEKIISNYGKKAGLKRCYPHKLRHTGSVLYLRNGGDVFSLQKKPGHTSLQMTRHYANLADSDVKAKHMKYGVADRLKG
ncbi:MAG TPA: tyrosine-type recombinase/integrase [Dehalococcoidia bacterium]|nr:tyrosine-type recombinase/integrase [Dehalococcoidia bacterium]